MLEPTAVWNRSRCRFTLWALVTRRVMLRRQAEEAFVEMAPLEQIAAIIERVAAPVVRALEVQTHASTCIDTQQALFTALFPPLPQGTLDAEEATARIVRVSAPITTE